MLHQDNGKKLSMKEAIVMSQDCPKLLGSPVTCVSQRAIQVKEKRKIIEGSRKVKEVEIS